MVPLDFLHAEELHWSMSDLSHLGKLHEINEVCDDCRLEQWFEFCIMYLNLKLMFDFKAS